MDTNKLNGSENELQPLDIDMIDMKSAREGIKVTIEPYPDMQVGDRIELIWNGRTLNYTIDEDEVNNAIEIEVPFADVKKIKNGSVPVYYQLYDRAGNKSRPKE
ncbi:MULTISPECIES: hypothetical protein [Bacillus]|uniref:hypothetical protein n=1 Tax=Bacillus TaxID=1386 RepID=UPI00065B9944|nr:MULTISPECIES: hypothetical protein [Bacillus]KMP23661.1 hypothetical protein TU50_28320 [Bacillus wiedmannii]MED3395316.1 hypothetical protein [Bacillus wiedmannii]OJD44206.1 hypothetical protein BAU22_20140 [Bacillus sp. 4048]TCD26822.1 hypothetical protein E0D84_29390 [Bacillus wiedmannii]TXR64467.1 hypothetical protein DM800_14735 [Bacillus sp. AY18-3]